MQTADQIANNRNIKKVVLDFSATFMAIDTGCPGMSETEQVVMAVLPLAKLAKECWLVEKSDMTFTARSLACDSGWQATSGLSQ